MLGSIVNGDLGLVHLNLHILDVKDAMLSCAGGQVDLAVKTFTTNEDVKQTRVRHLGEASLLLVVEGDVLKVTLNLAEVDDNVVAVRVADFLKGRELEVIGRLELQNIGQEVL